MVVSKIINDYAMKSLMNTPTMLEYNRFLHRQTQYISTTKGNIFPYVIWEDIWVPDEYILDNTL